MEAAGQQSNAQQCTALAPHTTCASDTRIIIIIIIIDYIMSIRMTRVHTLCRLGASVIACVTYTASFVKHVHSVAAGVQQSWLSAQTGQDDGQPHRSFAR
jgi:hypothetical protein